MAVVRRAVARAKQGGIFNERLYVCSGRPFSCRDAIRRAAPQPNVVPLAVAQDGDVVDGDRGEERLVDIEQQPGECHGGKRGGRRVHWRRRGGRGPARLWRRRLPQHDIQVQPVPSGETARGEVEYVNGHFAYFKNEIIGERFAGAEPPTLAAISVDAHQRPERRDREAVAAPHRRPTRRAHLRTARLQERRRGVHAVRGLARTFFGEEGGENLDSLGGLSRAGHDQLRDTAAAGG